MKTLAVAVLFLAGCPNAEPDTWRGTYEMTYAATDGLNAPKLARLELSSDAWLIPLNEDGDDCVNAVPLELVTETDDKGELGAVVHIEPITAVPWCGMAVDVSGHDLTIAQDDDRGFVATGDGIVIGYVSGYAATGRLISE